jgi:2-dehydro-3-deoxyphosphogalactonate aldolase
VTMLDEALRACPVIAILRGLLPENARAIGEALVRAGIRIIEVPMNSPDPLGSVRELAALAAQDVLVGVGTVLSAEQVTQARQAGAQIVLSPNADPAVIRQTKLLSMISVPGVATPTEGFAALRAGADALKLFPAENIGPAGVKAWRSVFAQDVRLIPVGGVSAANAADYLLAGAAGVGAGSSIFAPGDAPDRVFEKAQGIVNACHGR